MVFESYRGARPFAPPYDRPALALFNAHSEHPIVDQALRWHPHIFVSGPLAELEVGPVSRNIAGARRAAERILSV